ncbi:MAG: DUF885 domain-containing protein, partial [Myxococcales bacterium]|nr:DUF885 domain-containing protein [Myxococcales bacterium]
TASVDPPAAPPAPPAPVPPSDAAVRAKQLEALLAEHWEYTLQRSPEMASSLGDKRYNDKWSDRSPEAIAADLARTQAFLTRFEAISPTGFTVQQALDHRIIVRQLRERLANAKFEDWLMPVTQFGGVHIRLPQLVSQLSFATVKDYEDYIARLTAVPVVFDQTIALMQQGISKQLVPPRLILDQCLSQTQTLAKVKPAESPFAAPIQKFPETISTADQQRLRGAVLAAIQDKVLPAYASFATYLRTTYLAKGRKELGYSSLPDGPARYAARIKEMTTTDLSADEIHAIGLGEVTRIEGEQTEIAKRLGFASLEAFRKHVRTDKKLYAKSREAILASYQRYTDLMYAKLPALFGHLAKAKMIIKPVESFREKQAAGANYNAGSDDGVRPGAVQVNTYEPTKRLAFDAESIAYHEGVPGHHFQISIQRELTQLPAFRRHARFTAFSEGWGLYSERLGKEVGLYTDPYNDYGRLQSEMLRAIRLVVDTGVHHKQWSRAQVVKFFHDHSTIDEPSVQAETDRYIANPAQALAYKIGQLTISRLRERAQDALGTRFDVRAFHDEVLGAGALPLDVLEQRIDAWIARTKA